MLNPTNDLSTFDGLTPVRLLRRGAAAGDAGESIEQALRGPVQADPSAPPAAPAAQAVWHLPAAALSSPPAEGDAIVEPNGRRWLVLSVALRTCGTRWRCIVRDITS